MKIIRSRPFWILISLIISDGLFFGLTNPTNVPSFMVIVGFLLLLLTMYGLLYNFQKLLAVYAPWLSRQRNLVSTLTAGLGLVIALQSIGQLTVRDGLLIPLAAIALYGYFSLSKRTLTNT